MKKFWQNTSAVFLGVVVSQVIPIIAALFITRIYAPEAFGEYSIWLAIATFVGVVLTLRFEAALVIIHDEKARYQAVILTIILSFIVGSVFYCFILGLLLLRGMAFGLQRNYLLILPLAALAGSLHQLAQSWAAAEGKFHRLTAMRITQGVFLAISQILAGLYISSGFSLAVSYVIAGIVSVVIAFLIMPNPFKFGFFDWRVFSSLLVRYKKFPIFALPADAINSAAAQLPLVIIGQRYSADVVGYLALTMRVMGAPIGLIGKSVLDVFKRDAAQDLKEKGNCKKLYIHVFFVLSTFSLVMVVCTIFFGEDIFSIAFGKNWIISGKMAIWLLPLFAMRFVASPLSYMTYLVEKQYVDLYWQIGLMFVTVVSLYSFAQYQTTLLVYSFAYAGMYCLYLVLSYRYSKG
ncbi:MAG: hypothetical protein LDLANPLL_01644 [Turneriella sp.]|nr:hypothetical protein [Turneriella sp.]